MGNKGIEIDLSGLPQDKKGNVLWSKCVGELVPFIYNNEVDYLKIIGYCKQQVTIELDGKVRRFHVRDIYYNHIEPLLGVYTQKFLYEIGDTLGDFRVVEQLFIEHKTEETQSKYIQGKQQRKYRGYLVECVSCGKKYEVRQRNIVSNRINIKCNCNKKGLI